MVLIKRLFFLMFISMFVSCSNQEESTSDVIPQEKPEEKASSLFTQHCATCHGEDGKLGASGAKDLTATKLSGTEIENIIKKGKNAMPPMESLLGSEENVSLVVEHVLKLRQ